MINTMTGSPMLMQPYMPQNLEGKPGVQVSPNMTFMMPVNMSTPQQAAMRNPMNVSNNQTNQMDNNNFAGKDGNSGEGNTLGVAPVQNGGNMQNVQYSE